MDKYVKKKKIGEGSFGTALLVQSKSDGKNYVIKEINISKMKRKEKEEAKKEVSVLRKMKHPNIVSYTESFEELGNLYIVMDFCDGGDLYQQINARRGVLIPEDQIMDWFVQICLALKHVHDRKILHRDIKSQNIFLTKKGIIKLGDFGIARVLNNTMELARTCIGTPYYLSPEICENKPYNNKSDIWALGCVLYELCTLKHAFEAGNMKNLVLKIIRGSYPPVSPRYTYDMRNLINQLFKRNPRDRPSVNTILKKNFITKRIRKYLTDAQLEDEFSHTILHKGMEAPGPANRGPAVAGVKRPAERVSEGVRISGPAAKYGAPMNRRKPPVARKSSAERDRKPAQQADLEQKKRDLIAREKERRQKNFWVPAVYHEEMQFKAQKQKLVERQKMAQINKAREAGWKNTLSSNDSTNSSQGGGGGGMGGGGFHESYHRPLPQPQPQVQHPVAGDAPRGSYERYHDYLDNLNARQKVDGGIGNVALFRQDADAIKRRIQERPVSASAAEAAKRAQMDRNIAANAADRAEVVSEFLARKRQAEANKARAGFQMGWYPPQEVPPDRPQPYSPPADTRSKQEADQEYLEKLKAIRMQNFKERQILQQKIAYSEEGRAAKEIMEGKMDADARRKKIEALKAQADERAAKLKEQLEKQRREMYEREQKQWQEHMARKRSQDKSVDQKPPSGIKPVAGPAASAVSMTGVLQDVGVSVKPEAPKETALSPPVTPSELVKSPRQQAADRKKWGGGDGKNIDLSNLPLQETASRMEATSAADVVTKYEKGTSKTAFKEAEKETEEPPKEPSTEDGSSDQPAPRKKWGAPSKPAENVTPAESEDQSHRKKWNPPGDTVVGVLQKADILPMTMTIAKSGADTSSIQGSPLGVTVVKQKGSVEVPTASSGSRTIIIKEGKEGKDSVDVDALETINVPDTNTDDQKKNQTTTLPKKAWNENDHKLTSDPTGQTDITGETPKERNTPTSNSTEEKSEIEVDSGIASKSPSLQQQDKEENQESLKSSASVPPIRPMSAPSSREKPKYEETDIDIIEEQDHSQTCEESLKEKSEEPKENIETENIPNDESNHSQNANVPELSEKEQNLTSRVGNNGQDSTEQEPVQLSRDDEVLTVEDVETVEGASDVNTDENSAMEAIHEEALMSNVNLDDEDNDDDLHIGGDGDSSDNSPDSKKEANKSVISGLTVGTFDADSRLLRTCSLPDLSKLFRTTLAFNPFFEVEQQVLAAAAQTLSAMNPKEDEDDLNNLIDGDDQDEEEEEEDDSGEQELDDADEDADDEEEAYQSMVESMKHLLEAVDSEGKENAEGGDESPSSPCSPRDDSSPTGDDEENLEDTEASTEAKPINEDWDSGEGSYDDDGDEDDLNRMRQAEASSEDSESVFFRLEESRMELEHELGCDNFLKAYRAVQAIHEDEDENIEEGTRIVSDILGKSKQHLYTKILQLVMADGAYTEDNE
ncbi:Serine/threonine-protein kinase Nek1 [Holothuria leucospilota]|uniref:non-specific serine/threonine protein kinase n=1 Tax=Holothuria leucospilota TaxID=206669 RepID=A0A9Q1H119_HOLLE|nr:Serine/threonine-protein kinase Nek1 [Holothuria leucospilota]